MSDDSRCGSCRAPVLWATTTSGKAMPVDPVPAEGSKGNVWMFAPASEFVQRIAVVLSGPALAAALRAREPLHTSHFFTCPDAASHRRRG